MEKNGTEKMIRLANFWLQNILFLSLLPFPPSRTAHSFLFLSIKRFQISAYSENIQKHTPTTSS